MNQTIFRKKSLDKVKSPDQLNAYIQISNPSIWILLVSVLFLLLGLCLWGIFGQLRTVIQADAQCSGGVVLCNLTDQDADNVQPGMAAFIDELEGTVTEVTVRKGGGSTCILAMSSPLPDGIYVAQIELERIQPISFLTN